MNTSPMTCYPPVDNLLLMNADSPNINAVEGFVVDKYSQKYDAFADAIPHGWLPPVWVVKQSLDSHRIHSVAGLRGAQDSPLFVERHYLDRPIEIVLLPLFGLVERQHIVEIGNFTSKNTRLFMLQLLSLLHRMDFRIALFTIPTVLLNSLLRLGLKPTALIPAKPTKLDQTTHRIWGRYYQESPVIYCGSIPDAYRALSRERQPA